MYPHPTDSWLRMLVFPEKRGEIAYSVESHIEKIVVLYRALWD